jgi:glutathione S-transferase
MSLAFHYTPMTSSTRVHWALEELGVPYEKVKIDLAAGDHKKPEYLALNPNGKVPLLVADGTPIFESLAMLIYLGETYGVEKGLYPAPGPARGEALKWIAWSSVTLAEALSRVIRNNSERFPAEERNAAAGATAKKDIVELLGIVDRTLEGKDYLTGKDFTLADLSILTYLPFFTRMGIDYSAHKNVTAWLARAMTRPALGRAMAG